MEDLGYRFTNKPHGRISNVKKTGLGANNEQVKARERFLTL